MFNTITKFYNMLSEIIGIHTIKKKKRNKMYSGYMADDEFDNIIDEFNNIIDESGGGGGDGGCGGGCDGGDGGGDNTVMVDGLELILLKVLKL
jgi:hypothetical protein